MDSNSILYDPILVEKLSKIHHKEKITHLIQIRTVYNLNNDENENKLSIFIKNKKTGENSKFIIKKDDSLILKEKLNKILVYAISKGFVEKNSLVLFLFDQSLSTEYEIGILLIEVSKVVYRIAKFKVGEYLAKDLILDKLLEIIETIRKDGREGKKIGGLFIVGDENELSPFCKPLVLNPFQGYSKELKNLVSCDLSETIKEYALLDGAFIINNDGVLISAGTYIDLKSMDLENTYGLGTKHLAAIGITKNTKSIAILLSESGGHIKIYKKGKLILKY